MTRNWTWEGRTWKNGEHDPLDLSRLPIGFFTGKTWPVIETISGTALNPPKTFGIRFLEFFEERGGRRRRRSIGHGDGGQRSKQKAEEGEASQKQVWGTKTSTTFSFEENNRRSSRRRWRKRTSLFFCFCQGEKIRRTRQVLLFSGKGLFFFLDLVHTLLFFNEYCYSKILLKTFFFFFDEVQMKARLSGGHFRMLNEKLYTCT